MGPILTLTHQVAGQQGIHEATAYRLPPVLSPVTDVEPAAAPSESASSGKPSSGKPSSGKPPSGKPSSGKSPSVELPSLGVKEISPTGIRVTPYGAFWADMIYNTQRTFTSAYTLFAFSEDIENEATYTIDARRTRVGLLVDGPTIANLGSAKTGGKIEIDFHGDFVTENRASVLLREAYWEVKNEQYRVLVGQTWDVISPLYPDTLSYAYGYFAGNIGFRRAQFRAECNADLTELLQWTIHGSLNQDIISDFVTEPGIRREASSWPVIEARTALSLRGRGDGHDLATLGFSGHIGETGFDFLTAGPPPLNLPPENNARFRTWSFNVDAHLPVTSRCGIRGEFFTGENLSAFLGGVGQGVCPCLRMPIGSTGGWCELWYDWTSEVRSHLGYGIDDPNQNDILFGINSNQFIFVNIVWDVDARLTTGFEVTYFDTRYLETRGGQIPAQQLRPSAPGEAVTLNWMVKYAF